MFGCCAKPQGNFTKYSDEGGSRGEGEENRNKGGIRRRKKVDVALRNWAHVSVEEGKVVEGNLWHKAEEYLTNL